MQSSCQFRSVRKVVGRQKVMLETSKLRNALCQRQKTWSCSFPKAKNMVLPYVKTEVALSARAFSYMELPALYFLMPKTKFYTKMQSCTTKSPCYQTCDVFATKAPNLRKVLLDDLTYGYRRVFFFVFFFYRYQVKSFFK